VRNSEAYHGAAILGALILLRSLFLLAARQSEQAPSALAPQRRLGALEALEALEALGALGALEARLFLVSS